MPTPTWPLVTRRFALGGLALAPFAARAQTAILWKR
jgi:hypothetical protein